MEPSVVHTKNCISIIPYEKKQSPTLEAYTSIYDKVYHKRQEVSGFNVKYDSNQNCFLTYNHQEAFLKSQFPGYQFTKQRMIRPAPTSEFDMVEDFQLKPVQQQFASTIICSQAVGVSEWYANLQTGVGKTLLAVHLSSIFRVKTFIMCYLVDVLTQWINAYWHKTTIDNDRVLLLDSGEKVASLLNGKRNPDDYDIFLCTPNLISSIGRSRGYKALYDFINTLGIGFVIFDEAHRNMGNTIRFNATCNVMNTLYLSADYGQADYKKEEKFFRIFTNAMILKPDKEDISYKHTDIIVVDYNSNPSELDKLSINNRYGYSAMNYMDYQYKKQMIFRVVHYIFNSILTSDPKAFDKYRALVLFTNVEHVDRMRDFLSQQFKSLIIGRFHGGVADEEKYAVLQHADIIVATYSSFGVGRDVSKIKYVIGMNQSNKIEDNQAAGRSRPLEDGTRTKYFIPVDTGFPYCIKKLNTRLEYLMEMKGDNAPHVFHYYETEGAR